MKIRLLSLVLAVLLVFPGAAFAENTDEWTNIFADYSIDTLYALRVILDTEIASRENKDKEVTVPVGQYIVGIDIPEGIYTITSTATDYGFSAVHVFNQKRDIVLWETISEGEQIGKIELLYGYQIEISSVPVIFTTYKGLGF